MSVTYQYDNEDIHVPEEVSNAIEDLDLNDSSHRKAKTDILAFVSWVNNSKDGFPIVDDPSVHGQLIDAYLEGMKSEGYARASISGRWLWISRLYKELSMGFLNEYAFLKENPIEVLEDRTGKTRKDYLPKRSEQSQKKQQYYVDKDALELLCDNLPSPAFRNETMIRRRSTGTFRKKRF